jgi:hypothetical protein
MRSLASAAMRITPLLLEARPTEGHRVYVRFEDGLDAELDFSRLLDYGGVFESLRDPEFFRKVRADTEIGTIVWPGEVEIAPETLYADARRAAAGAVATSTR